MYGAAERDAMQVAQVNMFPTDAFPVHNTPETLFERLESKGLSWRIYGDPLPMCRSQASSMPPGCVTTSRTSSPPTGSWKTPSEESCRSR